MQAPDQASVMNTYQDDLEPDDYFNDFVKFVDRIKSGKFLIIITIEYGLPVECETLAESVTVWSSPQILTFPLEDCFERCVESFVKSSLRRFEDPTLTGLSFKWNHVDGIRGADVAQSN